MPSGARPVLRQYCCVHTPLVAMATATYLHAMGAHDALVTKKSFGVGRGFAVLVAIFALSFALMVLGGHLRASRQRKRRQERP